MELRTTAETERAVHIAHVEETLNRIAHHKGVLGYIVLDPLSKSVLKSAGFDENPREVRRYVEKLEGFIALASSTIRTIDWRDDMTFLRVSYGEYDLLVAPDLEQKYILIVVQYIS